MLDIKQKPTQAPSEPGDHDKFSHYVNKNALMIAMTEGVPVKALCEKMWIPTRDGEKFPVCPECKKRYEMLGE